MRSDKPQTGDDVTDDEKKVRTMFITYEADDDSAETFMIVFGSIADNFRGIKVVEFQDDTIFADGENAMTALHDMATSKSRLTPEQQQLLDEFSSQLSEWEGGQ
jgi:hypothetical protein